MLIGVLALQGDVAEHRAALAELGAITREVRRPADLEGIDGIVLPGGESTTMSMLLDSSGLTEPVGTLLSEGLPAFGTCAGMILLAREVSDGRPDQHCYGAVDIVVRRNAYGRQLESFEADIELTLGGVDPRPRRLHAVFIRAPVVEQVGEGVEVLARLARRETVVPIDGESGTWRSERADGGSSPVVCREGNVLVSAFHPELTSDRCLHDLFISMVRKPPAHAGRPALTHDGPPGARADRAEQKGARADRAERKGARAERAKQKERNT